MNKGNPVSFREGTRVTYESHGVCTVVGAEDYEYGGHTIPMILIRPGNGNIIRVAERVAKRDFQLVSIASQLAEVTEVLRQSAKAKPAHWHHTEKKYASVLGTSDVLALAELVRDLHPGDKPRGTELTQLYQTGLYQLLQLLQIVEQGDVSSILKQLTEGSGLPFREEDAKPSNYVAQNRGRQTSSVGQSEKMTPLVRLPKARVVAALPQPAAVQKPAVKNTRVPKAHVAQKSPAKVATTPKAKPATVPVHSKAVSFSRPSAALAPRPVAAVPRAVIKSPVTKAEPPVHMSPVATEDKKLGETIARLEAENKALTQNAGTTNSLMLQLDTARTTIRSLRTQLTVRENELSTLKRERQQHDREQATEKQVLETQCRHLTEQVGVFFGTILLLSEVVSQKPLPVAAVELSGYAEVPDETVLGELKNTLRHVRRASTLRKRQVEALKTELGSLRKVLNEANRTIDQQAARLADRGVDELLQALVVRKQEVDAATTLLDEKTKEANRLTDVVGRRDDTIEKLKIEVLTAKRLRAEIERVRSELFQYIFERTELVERLQAYIKQQKGRDTT